MNSKGIRFYICKLLLGNQLMNKLMSMHKSINIINDVLYELRSMRSDIMANNITHSDDDSVINDVLYELRSMRSNIIANNITHSDDDSGELAILADKYGTDKGCLGKITNHSTFPWYPHTYTRVYGMLFSKIRYNVKNIFECGIGTNNENMVSNMTSMGKPGASLRMWRDYFTNAIVWGGDIDKDILFSEERINTGYIDQTSKESINKFFHDSGVREFDIIIDDGLHTYEAAASLFDSAFSYLSSNGLYIIEDLAISDIIKFQEHVSCLNKKISVEYCIMSAPSFHLNNLVIIRNKEN